MPATRRLGIVRITPSIEPSSKATIQATMAMAMVLVTVTVTDLEMEPAMVPPTNQVTKTRQTPRRAQAPMMTWLQPGLPEPQ